VSGAPGGLELNSSASGFSRSRRAIIHRTVRCTPDSVRCAKDARLWNSPASGFSRRLLRYNSPDMSGVHRTVRCIHGATASRRHRISRRAHKSEPNGQIPTALVTWQGHRTCPVCTGLSGAPSCRQPSQRPHLVVGAINTPTTPPFIASKFSTSQLLQEL
jgi:hypothetical protein